MAAIKKRTLYIFALIVIILLIPVLLFQLNEPDTDQHDVSFIDKTGSPWIWENPYTYKEVSIPAEWQIAEGEQLQETLLTLTHETGRSLVYIIYEETVDPMSLPEFVEAMKAANQEELGTGEFNVDHDENGEEVYRSGGARYFGDILVATKVRIWSDEVNHFWRSIAMTNMEYKELEFETDRLIDILADSTK